MQFRWCVISSGMGALKLDHFELVRSLSTEQRQNLVRKSDRAGLMHFCLYWGTLVLVSSLIVANAPLLPLLLVVQGILIVFLFTLMHETIHRTVFATRWLNDAVAWLCGILLVLPPSWFRYFHFAHHRHTQDPQNDPELASAKPETVWQYVVHVSGLPVWWGSIKTLVRNALGQCDDTYVPSSGLPVVCREARLMLLIYGMLIAASVAFQSTILIYVWVVPALLGQPFLRLYLLAEHGRCAFVANMFENTRTTFTNRIVRFIAWNMPYHAEHHALPTVPFHKLPELHELTKEHLLETERGYGQFNKNYIAGISS